MSLYVIFFLSVGFRLLISPRNAENEELKKKLETIATVDKTIPVSAIHSSLGRVVTYIIL